MSVLFPLLLALTAAPVPKPAPFAQHAKLALRSAIPNRPTLPHYGRFELTLDLDADDTNPFDPAEIDVSAVFTSPTGERIAVAGFLDQPFTRRLDGSREQILPAGKPVWKVRFAPGRVGTWRCRI